MNFTINGRILKYFNEDCIFIYSNEGKYKKNPKWKKIIISIRKNYKTFNIGNKMYLLHRIIAYLFLNLNIEDNKQVIDHIDGDTFNNKINNLRIVTNQQNLFNTKAKGYSWNKNRNKFEASITLNKKKNHLGYFDTEKEARKAYLDSKIIYHSFSNNVLIDQ